MDDPHTRALHDLIRTGKLRKLKRGEIPHSSQQRPAVFLLVSGYIKRYRVDSNEGESIQLIYGPGDIFPLTPIFKQLLGLNIYEGPETYLYAALSDCEYYSLDLKKFIKGFEENSALYKDLLYICGRRIQTSIERLENLSLQSAERRIAHYFVRLARQNGEELPRGIIIRLPVTEKEVAENLGLKHSVTNRALSKFRKEGLITGTTKFVVLNLEKLEDLAYE